MQERYYQTEARQALIGHWAEGGGNALATLATGTGKSVIAARMCQKIVEAGGRVGVVTHVQELVEQNAKALFRASQHADAGIYSAGLNRRETHRAVTFASIQSIYKRAKAIGSWDLMLVDECHLIPKKGVGRYREFIANMQAINPDMRVGGLTATPYRLGEGRLDRGQDAMFECNVYDYGIGKGIADGYLSPLTSKRGGLEIDVSGIGKRGGELKQGELEARAIDITEQAVAELVERGQNRKSWLVFASGVEHAYQIRDLVRCYGISAEVVHGGTPKDDRNAITTAFRAGRLRCLVNMNVLTTGFDAPCVDLVGLMRSTLSTGLYVQMIGRGTRLSVETEKENCLVLDWGGNLRRHGPVDKVDVEEGKKRAPGEEDEDDDTGAVSVNSMLGKECPSCEEMIHIAYMTCPHCGHEFPKPEVKHDAIADAETPVLSTEKIPPTRLPVVGWHASRHEKRSGGTPTMCVSIDAGLMSYREWIAFEHTGYAQRKAHQWWREHGGSFPLPETIQEALDRFANELNMPTAIEVRREGKYDRIVGRAFASKDQAA